MFVYIHFGFQVSPKKVAGPRNIRIFGWLCNIITVCNNVFWKCDSITVKWFICCVILCGWNQSPSSSESTSDISSITCYHVHVMVTAQLPSWQNYSPVIPEADTAHQTMTYKLDIFWTPVHHSSISSFVYWCTWRGGGVSCQTQSVFEQCQCLHLKCPQTTCILPCWWYFLSPAIMQFGFWKNGNWGHCTECSANLCLCGSKQGVTPGRMNRTSQIVNSVTLSLTFQMESHGVLPTEWFWTLPVFWNCVP